MRLSALVLFPLFALGAFFVNGVIAESKHSCVGRYKIQVLHPERMVLGGERFKGQGSCGSSVKKRCYERGKDHAVKCMKMHAASVGKAYAPVECSTKYGVLDYNVTSLDKAIKGWVCPKFRGKDKVVVALLGETFGEHKECSGDFTLIREYTISCK
jgi:hypothetical protein